MFFQLKLLHRMSAEIEALSKPCQPLLPLRTINCQTQQQLEGAWERRRKQLSLLKALLQLCLTPYQSQVQSFISFQPKHSYHHVQLLALGVPFCPSMHRQVIIVFYHVNSTTVQVALMRDNHAVLIIHIRLKTYLNAEMFICTDCYRSLTGGPACTRLSDCSINSTD